MTNSRSPSGENGADPAVLASEARFARSQLSLYHGERASPNGLVQLGERQQAIREGQPVDWSATLDLVERAAATIKAYESRFLQLETHTRALMQRTSEEQLRLQTYILSLEAQLEDAHRRASHAEDATRHAELQEREASLRWKKAEARANEAEVRTRQSEAYLRRVHHLLAGI